MVKVFIRFHIMAMHSCEMDKSYDEVNKVFR